MALLPSFKFSFLKEHPAATMALTYSHTKSSLQELSPSTLAVAIAGLCFLLLLFREFRSWSRLSHVPGPFSYAISKIPMVRVAASGRLSYHLQGLGDKYGPLIRIGPNEVLYGDIDTFRNVMSSRSSFLKPKWYEGTRFTETHSIISMSDEEQHRVRKTKLAPGYSGRSNGGFEDGVNKNVAALQELIDRKYISTATEYRPMELSHKIMFFTLDVIADLGVGETLGFVANDEDMHRYIATNDKWFPAITVFLEMPFVHSLLGTWPFTKLAPTSSDAYGFGKLMGLITDIVDKRLSPGAEKGNDMLASHLQSGLTRNELLAEAFLKIVAGADTTAVAIRLALLFLLTNPSAHDTLRREIDSLSAAGKISSPITNTEATAMPYLQAVIKETLRMHPPATDRHWKIVPEGGAMLHGIHVPAGTMVGLNVLYIMRSKDVFGVDADVWRPERWIEAAAEDEKLGGTSSRYRDMINTVEAVFSHGRYICLGKSLAWTEMNKAVVELLRRYDFNLVNSPAPCTFFEGGFWMSSDFWVRITKREMQKNLQK